MTWHSPLYCSLYTVQMLNSLSNLYGGAVMTRIEFRGRTYDSESEMPPEVRQAYRREKENADKDKSVSKPLTDIVDMSPEVRAIYERALGNVEEKLASSKPTSQLPKTEDIYRQSAPEDMKHLPSDESIYRPSEPLIDPAKSVIEPESAFRINRFIMSLVWALLLIALIFVVVQFLR